MSFRRIHHIGVMLFVLGFCVEQGIAQYYSQPIESQKYVTLFGGASVPVGTFGEKYSYGAAKMGVSVGLDFMFPFGREYEAGITAAYNYQPFDNENIQYRYGAADVRSGGWSLIWGLTTFGFNSPFDESSSFYARGLLGFLIGVTPRQEAAYDGWNMVEESSSSVSFAYGMAAGFQINQRYELGVRLMSGNPQYEVQTTGQYGTTTRRYEQTATTVQLVVGVRLE